MTQKELLLTDVCGRLPYGIICKDQYGEYIDVNIYNAHIEHLIDQITSGVIKIVLRPMSSMTPKEFEEYTKLIKPVVFNKKQVNMASPESFDYLNKKMFDYRGLISKGLALVAPEGMYK